MEPSEADAARQVVAPADRLEELSASARGWHTIQMAVLGFIGICGVLRTTSSPAPRAVQWLADNSLVDDEPAARFLAIHADPHLP